MDAFVTLYPDPRGFIHDDGPSSRFLNEAVRLFRGMALARERSCRHVKEQRVGTVEVGQEGERESMGYISKLHALYPLAGKRRSRTPALTRGF